MSGRLPNLFFVNTPYSGASAIVPILQAVLPSLGYDVVEIGPDRSRQIGEFINSERPVFHWTQSSPRMLAPYLADPSFRFVFLHRDLRDCLVSQIHDPGLNISPENRRDAYLEAVDDPARLLALADFSVAWSHLEGDRVKVLTFDQVMADVPAAVYSILAFIGVIKPDLELVDHWCEQFSFERMTGRQRGEEGETIRTGFMVRRGVSGDWRKELDEDLCEMIAARITPHLIELGYADCWDWPQKMRMDEAEARRKFSDTGEAGLPNVIFVNCPYSGGKAIQTGLEHALRHLDYVVPPAGSSTSRLLRKFLGHGRPIFFNSLDGPDGLQEYIHRPDTKVVVVVRDPRDQLIAWVSEYLQSLPRDQWPDVNGLFSNLIDNPEKLAAFATLSCAWRQRESSSVKVVTFDEIADDLPKAMGDILKFVGVPSRSIQELVPQFTEPFVPFHPEGLDDGRRPAEVRVSGTWRDELSPRHISSLAAAITPQLVQLGCVRHPDWHLDYLSGQSGLLAGMRRRLGRLNELVWAPLVSELAGAGKMIGLSFSLAWMDVLMRYRRTVLGPFWVSLSAVVTIAALGFVYAKLFHADVTTFFPYVSAGLVLWFYISSAVVEAPGAFVRYRGIIHQVKFPYLTYVLTQANIQLIVFLHAFVDYVAVFIYLKRPLTVNLLYAIPGVLSLYWFSVWMATLLGVVALRFRDLSQVMTLVVQIAFLVTPIIWVKGTLGSAEWVLHYNPFYHLLEICREPLLGNSPDPRSWMTVLALNTGGTVLALGVFSVLKRKIAYWSL